MPTATNAQGPSCHQYTRNREASNIYRSEEGRWRELGAGAAPLPPEFYLQPTEQVALDLLGCLLVHRTGAGPVVGRIVETEAYLSQDDPGCHAARGQTDRNAPMFEGPGTLYVYQIYGVHYCVNLVTQPEGVPEAVLVRAVEPLAGIELMRKRRGRTRLEELANGPAKLTQAFGIGPQHNRGNATRGVLCVAPGPEPVAEIWRAPRIGIASERGGDLPLRFLVANCRWTSRRPNTVCGTIIREGESP